MFCPVCSRRFWITGIKINQLVNYLFFSFSGFGCGTLSSSTFGIGSSNGFGSSYSGNDVNGRAFFTDGLSSSISLGHFLLSKSVLRLSGMQENQLLEFCSWLEQIGKSIEKSSCSNSNTGIDYRYTRSGVHTGPTGIEKLKTIRTLILYKKYFVY